METWVISELDMFEKPSRQGGQTGYHQRTEFNKRILKISNPEDASITPDGGFLHYGEVKSDYVLVKEVFPGPAKRMVRFRDAIRVQESKLTELRNYVCQYFKQAGGLKLKAQVMNIVNNIQQDELDAGKLQEVYDIEVELGKKITLPDSFEAPHRPDMVKMAVASSRANRRQSYGSKPHNGKRDQWLV